MKSKKNRSVPFYKISISIIFGLLGFSVNFYTIIFPFGEYTAAILFGLLFPMLITLSWGWKYGLLSALAGGCQSMWWLWGPSNGYAILLVVPPFTLWVVWHGIFAELRRKQKTHKWWLSMYVVEIPFRILGSINLLTLGRWAITLNPPSWSWASNAPNTIPLHFSIFVTIKQAAVAFVVLLLADVLMNISNVRRFFKLKEYIDNRKTGFIISAFLLLGCLFWLLDSVFYAFAFYKENSFIDLLALDIPNYNIFTRTVFLIFCLICGLVTSRILRRQKEGEIALRENKEEFSQIIYGNSIATFVINKEHKITHWNKAAEDLTGVTAKEMIGTKNQWKPFYSEERPVMADIIVNELPDKEIKKYYAEKYKRSSLIEGAFEAEDFFLDMGEKGKWLFFNATPLKAQNGNIIGAIETLQNTTGRKQAEKALKKKMNELEIFNDAAVGRELMINESRKEINELLRKSGKEPKYEIVE
jgi:PAS domain S-box-containing protein